MEGIKLHQGQAPLTWTEFFAIVFVILCVFGAAYFVTMTLYSWIF